MDIIELKSINLLLQQVRAAGRIFMVVMRAMLEAMLEAMLKAMLKKLSVRVKNCLMMSVRWKLRRKPQILKPMKTQVCRHKGKE